MTPWLNSARSARSAARGAARARRCRRAPRAFAGRRDRRSRSSSARSITASTLSGQSLRDGGDAGVRGSRGAAASRAGSDGSGSLTAKACAARAGSGTSSQVRPARRCRSSRCSTGREALDGAVAEREEAGAPSGAQPLLAAPRPRRRRPSQAASTTPKRLHRVDDQQPARRSPARMPSRSATIAGAGVDVADQRPRSWRAPALPDAAPGVTRPWSVSSQVRAVPRAGPAAARSSAIVTLGNSAAEASTSRRSRPKTACMSAVRW